MLSNITILDDGKCDRTGLYKVAKLLASPFPSFHDGTGLDDTLVFPSREKLRIFFIIYS